MKNSLQAAYEAVFQASRFIDDNYAVAIMAGVNVAHVKEELHKARVALGNAVLQAHALVAEIDNVPARKMYMASIEASAEYFGLTVGDLLEPSRKAPRPEARRIASKVAMTWYGVRENPTAMAKVMRRDRTTVLHHIDEFNGQAQIYPDVMEKYEAVRKRAVQKMGEVIMKSNG